MSDSRQIILTKAQELFSAKGYEGVSVREIANEANVNLSMVSYYFGGKEGLYKEVISSYFEKAKELFSSLDDLALDAHKSKSHYLTFWKSFLAKVIELKTQNQLLEEILLTEFIKGLPYSYDIHKKSFPPMLRSLEKMVDLGKQKNWVKSDLNAFVFISMLISAIDLFLVMSRKPCPFQKFAKEFTRDSESWINQIIKIYFEGVLV